MGFRTSSIKTTLAAVLLFAICTVAGADIIYLNTGGIIKGKIIEEDDDKIVVETKFGPLPVSRDDIDFIESGTDLEIFQQRLKKLKKNDSDACVELGGWAQTVGLDKEAREMFKRAIEIEPNHYFARTELGHRKYKGKWLTEDEYNKAIGLVKYEGEWVTKEDAEKLKAGYVKYGDEWIKKEDLEMARKGYRKLGDKWVTKDEFYKAKGFLKYKDKWVKPEQLEKIKKADEERARREKMLKLSKQIKMAFRIRVSFEPNAQREHLEWFGKLVQKASETIWDMTGGGIYIAEAQIYDKKADGDCVVKNLDQNKVQHGGSTVYGYASAGKFFVGGKCLLLTFVHEFGHAKMGLPDHYGEQVDCVMNAGDGAKHMKFTYCTNNTRGANTAGCWETILKKYPGLKRPNEIGQDFEEPPETKIIISDN